MNRPFVHRGRPVAGVFQRCAKTCTADTCTKHGWSYMIELPSGPDGKRRQRTKSGFATGKEAMQARADLSKQHRDGTLPADDRKMLGEWLDEWLAGKVARGEIENSTARGYSDNIKNHIKPKLGSKKLRDLRGIDLTRFYEEIVAERAAEIEEVKERNARYADEAEHANNVRKLKGKVRMVRPTRVPVPRPLSPPTVARIHACISGALGDAVPDLIPRNVAEDAKKPKVTKKKVKPPKPDQLGGFLDAVEHERLYPLLVLAANSGLRRGELLGLKWTDIDMATGRLVVARQRVSVGYQIGIKDAKTEAGQDRVVYLDQSVLEALAGWAATQLTERAMWGDAYTDEGWIFTREDGRPLHPDRLTKVVSRLLKMLGVEGSLHALRHFWAAALISSGADIAVVSKMMGHASIAVTSDIYGSLFEQSTQTQAAAATALIPRRRGAQEAAA